MTFFSRFLGAEDEARSSASDALTYENLWRMASEGTFAGSKAGKAVTTDTALQTSTVYACVRILSDSVSTLPLDSFIRREGVRTPLRPRPLWMEFQEGPWSKTDVLGQIMTSLLLDGNAYVATYRDSQGRVQWLDVLDPARVTPERVGTDILFKIRENQVLLSRYDILHIRGMTLPGHVKGLSPIAYAKETIGLSLAATEMGATFFGNSATPGGVVEVPGKLSPEGARALKESWNEAHRGTANAHRLIVATDGATFSKVTLSPNEAQFLETRNFQVNDIARIYGVPTSLLQHTDGPEMGQSIQDKNTHFVQHSLRPWVERTEGALSWMLVSEGANPRGFVKINMDGLLRGDFSTRYATYTAAVRDGILTINEVRAFEDRPPVPWGDEPISVQVQEDPAGDNPPTPEEEL